MSRPKRAPRRIPWKAIHHRGQIHVARVDPDDGSIVELDTTRFGSMIVARQRAAATNRVERMEGGDA